MLQITHPDTILLDLQQRRQDSLRNAEKFHMKKKPIKMALPSFHKQSRTPGSLCVIQKTARCEENL